MRLLGLLKNARDNLEEVEKILDEIVREWDETHTADYSLATELDYLTVQIGNVTESARDFKRHMVEVRH
jgi:flagellin-specific chaperone FliS